MVCVSGGAALLQRIAKRRAKKPLDLNALTQEQRNAELQKGYDDVLAGRTKSADQVFDAIWREYGVERV